MEHIVQFAIGIDDESIVKRVTQVAEKQIVKAIQEKAEDQLFETSYGRRCGCVDWVKDKFDAFLQSNRDEIISIAADRVAEKIARSKTAKEILGRVAHEPD